MKTLSFSARIFAFALLAVFANQVAAEDQGLESGLVAALRLKKGMTERAGDSGKAIQAYMREGLVNKKPNLRSDYTDYYLLNLPAKFMGHDLLVIEEEYMTKYVGCCVSPGAGVSVRVVDSTKNLQAFAKANKCSLTEHVDLRNDLKDMGIKSNLPAGEYATLSCRERDAMK